MKPENFAKEIRDLFESLLAITEKAKNQDKDRAYKIIKKIYKIFEELDSGFSERITVLAGALVMHFVNRKIPREEAISYIETLFELNEAQNDSDEEDSD